MEPKKRIAIYIRVSTLDQSTDMQRDELVEYAHRRSWEVIAIYNERATGTKDTRPMLLEMLKAAHQRKFDILLVWKLDRLARSLKHLMSILQDLHGLMLSSFPLKTM